MRLRLVERDRGLVGVGGVSVPDHLLHCPRNLLFKLPRGRHRFDSQVAPHALGCEHQLGPSLLVPRYSIAIARTLVPLAEQEEPETNHRPRRSS